MFNVAELKHLSEHMLEVQNKETSITYPQGPVLSRNVLPHISDQCTEVECHLVKLVKVSLQVMGTS